MGNLDFHYSAENKRKDPERFIRSSFKALSLQVKNPDNYPLSPEVRRALSLFSEYIGKDKTIVVTDGNRPKDSETGVQGSQHKKNKAADIYVVGQSHLQTANQALKSGLFNGIGWYEEGYYNPEKNVGPHVHVDLRGTIARWGYDKPGEYYPGYFPKYPK